MNLDSKQSLSILSPTMEPDSRSHAPRVVPLRLPCSDSPCLSSGNDMAVVGSPSRQRAMTRGLHKPPVRPNRRVHMLTTAFGALSLSDNRPARHDRVSRPVGPWREKYRRMPRSSQKAFARQEATPMSICRTTKRAQETIQHTALHDGSPMSICQPSPRLQRQDSAIQLRKTSLRSPLVFNSPIFKDYPPIVYVPTPRPLEPVAGQQSSGHHDDRTPPSPPGAFLEELREMGLYNGPSQVQQWCQLWNKTEEEVLEWYYTVWLR